MANPSYTTDLILISNCDSNTDWAEWVGWTAGGTPAAETDYFIEGTGCISQTNKTGIASLGYDYGSTITFATGDVYMAWMYSQCPNALATQSSGGQRLVIGTTLSDYKAWYVGGSDLYIYGGWNCVPVDPTITEDFSTGTITTYQFFGSANNVTGNIQKGNPHGVDVLRQGRAESIFTLGDSTTPATFTGFGTLNDTNRWGLIQPINGGYLYQGLMSLGSTATAVYFVDSNQSLNINAPLKITSTFNKIEVNNASSYVEWNSISLSALGTISKGDFEMVDNATVIKNGCTFTDLNTFLYQSGATITDTTYRRTNQITQSGATFTGCLFTNLSSSTSLLVDDLDNISNCSFVSDGSNHGMELTTGNSGGTFILSNCSYSNYATTDGSTGNEAIYNNSESDLIISIDGGDTPSIRNGTNSTTTIQNLKTLTLTNIVEYSEVRVYLSGTTTEVAGIEDLSGTSFVYTYNYVNDFDVDIVVLSVTYEYYRIESFELTSSNSLIKVNQIYDRWYSNPV